MQLKNLVKTKQNFNWCIKINIFFYYWWNICTPSYMYPYFYYIKI